MRLSAVEGDITRLSVDAVVNAANNRMRGGGGVDGAIHHRGGPSILEDCMKRFPNGLATGDAGWTTAGDLPAKWGIHVVGPIHGGGQRAQLVSCYRRAMTVAFDLGAHSIAFPLISSGAYGWPFRDAVAAAIEGISATSASVEDVRSVSLGARRNDAVNAELAALGL